MNQLTIQADTYHAALVPDARTCFIDGRSIQVHLAIILAATDVAHRRYLHDPLDLAFAWEGLDWPGDLCFIHHLLASDTAILPVLLCPEDNDLSCIVVVVDVEKTPETVLWKRIGYVDHKNEDFSAEMQSGILCTDAYTEADWLLYGDNIAGETTDSPVWRKWISDHWDEELFRRRINYTLPYYRTEGNIVWMKTLPWQFDRADYEKCVSSLI